MYKYVCTSTLHSYIQCVDKYPYVGIVHMYLDLEDSMEIIYILSNISAKWRSHFLMHSLGRLTLLDHGSAKGI